MNTEEKFVHPDIQTLQTETSPNTLRARILTSLQEQKEKKSMKFRNNMIRFSAVTAAAVIVGGLMMSTSASASLIDKVHAAFQDANRYHVKSYNVTDGKRTLVSETWVDGKNHHMVFYDEKGKPIDEGKMFGDLSGIVTSKIKILSPAELADGKFLDGILGDLDFKKVLEGIDFKNLGEGGVIIMGPDGQVVKNGQIPPEIEKQIKELTENLKIKDVKSSTDIKVFSNGDLDKILKDIKIGDIEIGNLPSQGMVIPMMGGQNGAQSLRSMLSEEELWNIQRGVNLNGRRLDHYKLKDGLMNLELFVDPGSLLPVLTRTQFPCGDKSFTIEDEYDYVTPMPQKPAPKKPLVKV